MKKATLDLTGEKFGKITVLSFSRYFGNFTYWNCVCECGKDLELDYKDLLSEKVLSCKICIPPKKSKLNKNLSNNYSTNTTGYRGIYADKKTGFWKSSISYKGVSYFLGLNENIEDAVRSRLNGEKIIDKMRLNEPTKVLPPKKPTMDLVGQKFGKLTVISFAHFKGDYAYWLCKCDCGKEKKVYQANLLNGSTSSCGCARIPNGKLYHDKNLTYYDGVIIEKAAAKVTPKNNTSGFRGVTYVKKTNKWRAKLIFKGVRYELGHYHNIEDAIKARLAAEEMIDDFLESYFEKDSK